ncbi:hypothetical protein GCM10022245_60180 [Streptomyces mayteni]
MSSSKPNPFHVLGLPVSAEDGAVVERYEELALVSGGPDDRALAEWAKDELTGRPETRRLHEVFEPPGADYRGDDLRALVRKYGRSPLPQGVLAQSVETPAPEHFDLAAVMRHWLETRPPSGVLGALPTPDAEDLGIRRALIQAPVSLRLTDKPPLEVRDVLFG